MSIHWEAFNKDLNITPTSLVDELKRITVMPAHSSVAQFLDVYAKEAEQTAQPWRATMLQFCVAVWLFRAYKCKPDAIPEKIQEMNTVVTNLWLEFTELVDALPDIWDENREEP